MSLRIVYISIIILFFFLLGCGESVPSENISFQMVAPYPILEKHGGPLGDLEQELIYYTISFAEDREIYLHDYRVMYRKSQNSVSTPVSLISQFLKSSVQFEYYQRKDQLRFKVYTKDRTDSMTFIPYKEWEAFDDDVVENTLAILRYKAQQRESFADSLSNLYSFVKPDKIIEEDDFLKELRDSLQQPYLWKSIKDNGIVDSVKHNMARSFNGSEFDIYFSNTTSKEFILSGYIYLQNNGGDLAELIKVSLNDSALAVLQLDNSSTLQRFDMREVISDRSLKDKDHFNFKVLRGYGPYDKTYFNDFGLKVYNVDIEEVFIEYAEKR